MPTSRTSARRLSSLLAAAAFAVAGTALPAGAASPATLLNDTASTTCAGSTCTHEMANRLTTQQTFVVPDEVTDVAVELAGGPSGGSPGGALRTVVPVTPGETLTGFVTQRNFREEPVAGAGRHGATFLFRGEGADAVLLAATGGGRDGDSDTDGDESRFGDLDGAAGNGLRYLAPGLEALEPAPETVEAADDFGRLAIQWERTLPVLEPVLLDANGEAITGTLTTRTFRATGSGLPAGWLVRVQHGPNSSSINARYARVGDDGTFDVPYTLHNQERRGSFWIDVRLSDGDGIVAQERISLALPPVAHETVLAVPTDVVEGAPTTVEIARTGAQFGEPTIGLALTSIAYYLESGTAQLLLDDEPLDLDVLTLPDEGGLALNGRDSLPVTFTAPAEGTHTLTIEFPEDHRSGAVTTSTDFVVTAATAGLSAESTDPETGPATGAGSGTPIGPEVLAGSDTTGGTGTPTGTGAGTGAGLTGTGAGLADTGARVTGLAFLAFALMAAGAALVRARRPHHATARHAS